MSRVLKHQMFRSRNVRAEARAYLKNKNRPNLPNAIALHSTV
jgi:hypothetical protein